MTPWSKAEDDWLMANRSQYASYVELAASLNAACGGTRTGEAIKVRLNHNYKCGLGRPERTPYSEAEKQYLLAHYKTQSLRDLANGIYQLSGRRVTRGAISHYLCDTLGINLSGRSGPIKKGERIGYVAPIGTERINNDGYTLVKVSDTGIKNADWKTKQVVEWERIYGKKPDGIVVFLNSDKTDFSKENLYCMSRKVNLMMNGNHWFTESREHTLTAIRWCELQYAIKDNIPKQEGDTPHENRKNTYRTGNGNHEAERGKV